MDVTKTLRPGDCGTARLLREYGGRLICVRYRIDRDKNITAHDTELCEQEKQAMGKWDSEARGWFLSYEAASKLGLEVRIIKRLALLKDR